MQIDSATKKLVTVENPPANDTVDVYELTVCYQTQHYNHITHPPQHYKHSSLIPHPSITSNVTVCGRLSCLMCMTATSQTQQNKGTWLPISMVRFLPIMMLCYGLIVMAGDDTGVGDGGGGEDGNS